MTNDQKRDQSGKFSDKSSGSRPAPGSSSQAPQNKSKKDNENQSWDNNR